MTDAEVYEASGWHSGEDGHDGCIKGVEWAAQRAREQANKERMRPWAEHSIVTAQRMQSTCQERAGALEDFAALLEA